MCFVHQAHIWHYVWLQNRKYNTYNEKENSNFCHEYDMFLSHQVKICIFHLWLHHSWKFIFNFPRWKSCINHNHPSKYLYIFFSSKFTTAYQLASDWASWSRSTLFFTHTLNSKFSNGRIEFWKRFANSKLFKLSGQKWLLSGYTFS